MTALRIAIVGAGPGGLTLARLLQMRGYVPLIFEKDESPAARSQGGSLDLHAGAGLDAIHLAELTEPFQAIARYEDQQLRILDKMGTILLESDEAASQHHPEVDRVELRAMLIDSLVPDSIHWANPVKSVRSNGDGTHTLLFENGHSEPFDLVVGADGAWSRVRPILSAASPVYAGETYIELTIDDVDRRHPAVASFIGRGSLLAVSGYQGLATQRNAHGHIRVYVTLRTDNETFFAASIDTSQPEKARTQLLTLFDGWSADLLEVIRICNDDMVSRPLYTLPIGHSWEMHPGVTLIGDAAHLMPPFAGQGVNQAMQDAVELARALTEHSSLESAIQAYEQGMFPRAKKGAEITEMGRISILGSDAPASTLAYFRRFIPA
jgi:2-polyprenyl-6-methoxyphenol hydroxylase-like FAD-dependent oxidoreductase